jgi:PAS domain S-box-containing protein
MLITELLFTLHPNPYAFFPVLTSAVSLYLAYLILSQGIEKQFQRWLVGLFLTMVVAGIAEMFARMSVNYEGSVFWWSLENTMQVLLPGFVMGWTLTQIGWGKLVHHWRGAVLFIPAIILVWFTWFGDGIIVHDPDSPVMHFGGFHRVMGEDYFYNFLWMNGPITLSAIALFIYRLRSKDLMKKKQADLFLAGFLITILMFALGSRLQESLLGQIYIPAGGFFSMPLMILIAVGVVKYRLFYINPATIVENIVRTISEILMVVDPKYEIEYAGGKIEKILGYEPELLVNTHLKDLVGSNWIEFEEKVFKPLREGSEISGYEANIVSKSGEVVPMKISASSYSDEMGNVHGVVIVMTDLRDMHEILYLAAERNKLEVITSSITDGILGVDLQRNITLVNPAALKLLGGTEEDIIGKPLDSVFAITQDGDPYNTEELISKGAVGEDRIVASLFNAIIKPAGGDEFPGNIISSSIKEGVKVNLGAIISIHNLSQERDLERMKLDFVSMAAHELRTPLTSIRGYLDILKHEIWGKIDDDERLLINRVDISALQLTGLMENLLSVTKIEKGTYQLNVERVNWVKLVQHQVEDFKFQAEDRKLDMQFVCEDETIPLVLVDPLRIVEVLNNLMSNAIRYTPQGSITVKVSYDDNKKLVVTTVNDTGQGIPKEAVEHMFQKFFRVSGVLEQGSKGTGLGLYIARAIVELHGGEIWVESDGMGKGSTFGFTIPIADNSN